MMKQTMTRKHS